MNCGEWMRKPRWLGSLFLSQHGKQVVGDIFFSKRLLLKDSVRRRCSVLQWNLDFATHLVVASDEDTSPSVRLWDRCAKCNVTT